VKTFTSTARLGKALFALLLAVTAPAAWAQIYKWVDEKGRVYYGEKPPAGAKASAVKPPAQSNAPAAPQDLQSQELEFKRRQVQRGQDEEKQARDTANRAAQCDDAKERLAISERARLYRREKGERVFFSDAEQKAEIESRRAAMTQHCR
jgi:hypothetical protein